VVGGNNGIAGYVRCVNGISVFFPYTTMPSLDTDLLVDGAGIKGGRLVRIDYRLINS